VDVAVLISANLTGDGHVYCAHLHSRLGDPHPNRSCNVATLRGTSSPALAPRLQNLIAAAH